ncbi:anti-sigma factor family protein, partial [Rhodopirellula bahusiensis]
MSLKPEQIDQLISDHLDGRLSDDQSQWLAEQLRMDADLAQRITDAEFDRQMLRSLHQSTTTSSSLPSDFASRVVAAAQQRAIDDELSSDHPLRKLPVSVPVESVIPQSSRNARRTWVAAIAGLAAAGLLVASLQNGLSDPDPNNPIGDPSTAIAQADPAIGDVAPNNESDSERSPAIETIASNDVPNDQPSVDSPTGNLPIENPEAALPAMNSLADQAGSTTNGSSRPEPNSIASANDTESTSKLNAAPVDMSATVAAGNNSEVQSLTGAVLIYDVQLKPEARDPGARNHFALNSDPVRKAMTTAGLSTSSKQLVNERLIEATRDSVTIDDNTRYQILLLRGPAKQLDRLFLELL